MVAEDRSVVEISLDGRLRQHADFAALKFKHVHVQRQVIKANRFLARHRRAGNPLRGLVVEGGAREVLAAGGAVREMQGASGRVPTIAGMPSHGRREYSRTP